MSKESIEVVRGAWDAWRRGDIDAVVARCDPEMVWDMTNFREWPDTTYRGREGFRRFMDEWRDGKIIRNDNYDDRSKALKAAGLSE